MTQNPFTFFRLPIYCSTILYYILYIVNTLKDFSHTYNEKFSNPYLIPKLIIVIKYIMVYSVLIKTFIVGNIA